MRPIVWAIAVSCLTASAACAADDAATEITKLEAALGEAMIHRDTGTMERIISSGWVCQGDGATLTTKQGLISDIRSGKLVMKSFRLHDSRVHVLGDVAYMLAADDEVSSYAGRDGSGTYNWMDVWVKRDGHWVSVATQITKRSAKP